MSSPFERINVALIEDHEFGFSEHALLSTERLKRLIPLY